MCSFDFKFVLYFHYLIFTFILCAEGFMLTKSMNFSFRAHQKFKNVGKPLFLTPLLEKGEIHKARQLSSVHLHRFKGLKSFSGYFTVNETCESNLFFWFFPAQKKWKKAPVVLWLQGGPGAPSMVGLLEEMGPITSDGESREFSWHKKNNLLFIDQPVGTGYSFTSKNCYPKNMVQVRNDLYSALVQFFQMFPFLQKNKFFLTGQSFAGHYIPSVAYAIHKNNPHAKIKINLSGLMIGNGLLDIVYQGDHGNYLYQLGLIDDKQRDVLDGEQSSMVKHLKRKNWQYAVYYLNQQYHKRQAYMGNISDFNFLEANIKDRKVENFMSLPENRKALHVGNNAFYVSDDRVRVPITDAVAKSVKPEVEELLEHYPIVFYYGQLDIVCGYPMAVRFLRALDWGGAADYLTADRRKWCVGDQLVGYWKSARNLHEVLVRAAGHSVPTDQPLWAFHLMDSVTSSPPEDPLRQLQVCSGNL